MTKRSLTTAVVLSCWLLLGARHLQAAPPEEPARLGSWPLPQRERLQSLLTRHGHRTPAEYAVFDADNTLWQHDLEEALLPYLEHQGLLTPATVDPSLLLLPPRPGESLYGLYHRLSGLDDKVAYPWIAQVFAGFSLVQLKRHVDELYALGTPIPVRYAAGGTLRDEVVHPPVIFPAQRELIRALRAAGIEVYVVTAAHEELVRLVVSDPRHGLEIAPENVIGVTTLLRDPTTGDLTTARKQIERGHFLDGEYPLELHRAKLLTAQLWSPTPWYVGKLAAIQEYIHPLRRPVLVAGDAASDFWMLMHCRVEEGGVRLWVDRKNRYEREIRPLIESRAAQEKSMQWPVTADQGWLVTTAAALR